MAAGGGVARHHVAVFADRRRQVVEAGAARHLQDLLLVEAEKRAQHRNRRRGLGDHRQVLQGLRGDLPDRLAGDERQPAQALCEEGAGAHHLPFEHDLPVRRPGLFAQLGGDRLEVELEEARPAAVAPALGDHLHHLEHAQAVGGAAQVAEEIVELHAAFEHQTARHRGVEAAGDERESPPLDADRQAPPAAELLTEEVGPARLDLDPGHGIGCVEVDARRTAAFEQGAAERHLDLLRVEGDPLALAAPAGAHGEAPAAHPRGEEGDPLLDQVGEVAPGAGLGDRDRLQAMIPIPFMTKPPSPKQNLKFCHLS